MEHWYYAYFISIVVSLEVENHYILSVPHGQSDTKLGHKILTEWLRYLVIACDSV